MMPLVGVFAAAAIAGAGAMLGWRLARDHLLPHSGTRRRQNSGDDDHPSAVIEADYVDLTDVQSSTAQERRRRSD